MSLSYFLLQWLGRGSAVVTLNAELLQASFAFRPSSIPILHLASQLSGCSVPVGVCLPSVCAGDASNSWDPRVNLARAKLKVLQGCAWTLSVFLVYNAAVQV